MRAAILAAALILPASAAIAAPAPRGILMAYECKQIDPEITGFSCHFDRGDMRIQWHESVKEMSPERRERSEYEFNKIAVRYFELGGNSFDVDFDSWPEDRKRTCGHPKGKAHYVMSCSDYTVDRE